MKIITHDQIRNLRITPPTCYQWIVDSIRNKKQALLPPKISLHPSDGVFCNFMPCMINYDGNNLSRAGIKVVNRYPQRVPSLDSKILLIDNISGDFLALIDGNWITAMRTGAVAAHSILLFAKSNFKTIGLMGLGNVMRAMLVVLESQINGKELYIKLLRHNGQEESFRNLFSKNKNLHFSFVDTYEELIRDSDVIASAVTYLKDDICTNNCLFKKGVLVVPIHTRGFTNCDLFFDKVYGDDEGHLEGFLYFSKFKQFHEVSDVVNGLVKGRENDEERILAYNIGLSIHDIYYASKIYDLLKDNPSIQEVNLDSPKDKFWIENI